MSTPLPLVGLILTSAPDVATVRAACDQLQADVLKVVTGWGLPWTDALRHEAARLTPQLIVRTVHGDPSVNDGAHGLPYAAHVVREIAPWYAARDPERPFWIEIGNEPLLADQPDETLAWSYAWHLQDAIAACRAHFPAARIIGPAHLLNHPIRLGTFVDGQARFVSICADALRRCDALSLHVYNIPQYVRGLHDLRTHVGSMPVWITEFALNETLSDAQRGAVYASTLRQFTAAGACLYHLATTPGSDPIHFNPRYRLSPAILQAFRTAWGAPPPSDALHWPELRVDGFAMDVRQWRTVAAFRDHLARYPFAATAPWAKGVVIHHTYRPTPAQWRGAESLRTLAHFYRNDVSNGAGQPAGGWNSGPHLFIAHGSPNPAHDGIWQLTPLNVPGTHARAANTSRWGLEHVGDFTRQPMPPALAALGQGAADALLRWAGLPVNAETISPHSQWGKPTCPGRGVDMAAYRRAVAQLRGGA